MILRRVYVVALIEIIIFLLVILFYVFNTIRRHGNIVGDSPFGRYGEEIALKVYGYGLHKDEYIKVRYYKHSKYGKVVYE